MSFNLKSAGISVLLITGLFSSTGAWAGPSVTFVGLGDFFRPTSEPDLTATQTQSSSPTLGGGAWLDFMMNPHMDLEVGALYVPRKFRVTSTIITTVFIDSQSTELQLPVLLRFHLSPMFTIGVGGYYGMAMGKLKNTDQDGTVTESEYAAAGYKKAEFGFVGSVGMRFPLGSSASLILDGRYVGGLSDTVEDATLTTPTTKFKSADIQAFVGVQFGMNK